MPVISVGNLVLGGTGKTPMVIALARLFAHRKVAIISRGYGGKARGRVNIVSDGKEVFLDAVQAGDEPNLMASLLPGTAVLTGHKRIFPARYGVEQLGAGLLILDDGFQHMSLCRDLDMVLFKVDTFLGNNRILPGGDMREPLSALKRAHCFVLTCVDEENSKKADAIEKALRGRFPGIPVFQSSYEPTALVSSEGDELPLTPRRCAAFCGLAAPRHFGKSLAQAGIDVAFFKAFADHHVYSRRDLARIEAQARRVGADVLLTTEKDLVKLRNFSTDLPLLALRMETKLSPALVEFVQGTLADV